jgi:anti-anti-sigma factor
MKPLKDFDIKRETKGGVIILRLIGLLDDYTFPRLQTALNSLQQGGHNRVVVNCNDIDYISSTGLRSIVEFARAAREKKGDMILVNVPDKSKSIIDVLGFAKELKLLTDEKAAIKQLAPPEEPEEGEKK